MNRHHWYGDTRMEYGTIRIINQSKLNSQSSFVDEIRVREYRTSPNKHGPWSFQWMDVLWTSMVWFFYRFPHHGDLFLTRTPVVNPALVTCNYLSKKIFTFSSVTDEEFETCPHAWFQILEGDISRNPSFAQFTHILRGSVKIPQIDWLMLMYECKVTISRKMLETVKRWSTLMRARTQAIVLLFTPSERWPLCGTLCVFINPTSKQVIHL